jgi:hypothetical protein
MRVTIVAWTIVVFQLFALLIVTSHGDDWQYNRYSRNVSQIFQDLLLIENEIKEKYVAIFYFVCF